MNFLLPAWTLTRRESPRFWGEWSRVAGFADLDYFLAAALPMMSWPVLVPLAGLTTPGTVL